MRSLKTGLSVALNQSPFLNVASDDKVVATLRLMARPPDTKLTPAVSRLAFKRAGHVLCFAYIMAAFCAGTHNQACSQSIEVSPSSAIADQTLTIQVHGLKPGEAIILRAFMHDKDGREWQSYAGFMPDAHGNIDLSRQSPVTGTYQGISPMGLILSMQLPNPDYGRARFNYEWATPLVTKLVAESDGKLLASTEFSRTFAAPDVTTRVVRTDGLVGTLFVPPGTGPFPALIALGGSEGGNSAEDVGALLSSHGYVCLALAYFGADSLPGSLEEIPLEYFVRALDWLADQKLVSRNRIGILGTSKGAEAALLLAARDSRIRAVVAYEPSGVVWSCLCEGTGKSSWSWKGGPVAFVPFQEDPANRPPEGFPMRIGHNYEFSLNNKPAVQKASIPVEMINGPILLISGKDDQLWPSFRLGKGIMQRLAARHHRFRDRQLAYPDAGHLIGKAYLPVGATLIAGGQIETGGNLWGNAKAQEDSWPNVLTFLHHALTDPLAMAG